MFLSVFLYQKQQNQKQLLHLIHQAHENPGAAGYLGFGQRFGQFHQHGNMAKQQPGGGNSNIFYFHPDPWGDDPIWLAHIFQMGGSTTNQLVVTDRVVYFATLFRFEKNSLSQSPKGKECLGTLGGGFQFEHMPEVIRCQKNSWVLSSIQFELYTFRYLFIISLYIIYLLVVHNHYPPEV